MAEDDVIAIDDVIIKDPILDDETFNSLCYGVLDSDCMAVSSVRN